MLQKNRDQELALGTTGKGGELAFRLLERGMCQGLNPADGRPDARPAKIAVTFC